VTAWYATSSRFGDGAAPASAAGMQVDADWGEDSIGVWLSTTCFKGTQPHGGSFRSLTSIDGRTVFQLPEEDVMQVKFSACNTRWPMAQKGVLINKNVG
jgi:hypothetical protein